MTLITLQVGERRYFSEENTLVDGSAYFKKRLTGASKDSKEADGSYFIDRDGHLFEHILSFLRTGICPLFHDNTNGYDHAKYGRLGAEAEYFGVKKLHDWIHVRSYEGVVSFTRRVTLNENLEDMHNIFPGDDKLEDIPMWGTRKVYLCPRGFAVHRGRPDSCGRHCRNTRKTAEPEYEDEQVLVLVRLYTSKIFHHRLLKT